MLEQERHGEVALVRLAHGKASAMDLEFCRALEQALSAVLDSDARALVLTGSGSIFSAGVDLVRLTSAGRTYVIEFLDALDALFLRLLAFDKPLVAAVNGHAIAGGCLMAGACDLRLMARGNATYGAPELKVGVPFPALALEIARLTFPPQLLNQALFSGRLWKAEECLADGLVDELVAPEALSERALERARALASVPHSAYALTKRLARLPAFDTLDRHAARVRGETHAAWCSDEVQGAVRAYVEKTLRRT